MKLLLFDIDGTLIHAGGSAESAFESAFESVFGVAECWGKTIPHGRTDPDIVQEICRNTLGREIDSDEYTRLCDEYVKRLEPSLSECSNFRVLPGVPELIQTLHRHPEVCLGLETGNIQKAAYVKLKRASLDTFFPVGGFGSDNSERSEIVRIANSRAIEHYSLAEKFEMIPVVVIGDAPQDVEAGKIFGAQTIAVATGRYSAEELARYNPDAIFSNFSDLDAFLQVTGISQ